MKAHRPIGDMPGRPYAAGSVSRQSPEPPRASTIPVRPAPPPSAAAAAHGSIVVDIDDMDVEAVEEVDGGVVMDVVVAGTHAVVVVLRGAFGFWARSSGDTGGSGNGGGSGAVGKL